MEIEDIEKNLLNYKNILIMISGPMKTGKSKILLNYYYFFLNNNYKKDEIITFINEINQRDNKIYSRSNNYNPIESIKINNLYEIESYINNNHKILIIDEFQFFNEYFDLNIINNLKFKFNYILISGLNKDYNGNKFGYINELLYITDIIYLLSSKCDFCNSHFANYNYKIKENNNSNEIIDLKSDYLTLCFKCYYNK